MFLMALMSVIFLASILATFLFGYLIGFNEATRRDRERHGGTGL